ncbi:MAG: recombination mediator RecR [Candidatus Edwardsbacteria bacterium]
MYTSKLLRNLIEEFTKLPGIGTKTAQRLAFYLLKIPKEEALPLAKAIESLKERVRFCSVCFNATEDETCSICKDSKRDRKILCVVEKISDLVALEKSGEFKGHYHILQGALSPLDGIGPEQLRVKELLNRLRNSEVDEVIIATAPNAEGEATALYLAKLIKPLVRKVTRIARGLPVGSELEYADEVTLSRALEGRREM